MAKNNKSVKKDGADEGAKGEAEKAPAAPKPQPKSQPPAGSMLAKLMEAQRKKRDEIRAKNEGKVSDHSATRSREFGPMGGPKVGDGPKGGAGAMRRTAPGA